MDVTESGSIEEMSVDLKEKLKQKVLELIERPREEVLAEYEKMNDEISSLDKNAYVLWKRTYDRGQARAKAFGDVRNLYKSRSPGEECRLPEATCKMLEKFAINQIVDECSGARFFALFLPKGRSISIDDLSYVFRKARYHPLRSTTVESDLPISEDIARKLVFVDYDSPEKSFTGFVHLIALYYEKMLPSDNINNIPKIKPNDYASMLVPIDIDPSEYRMLGVVSRTKDLQDTKYSTILFASWLYPDAFYVVSPRD